MTEPRDDAYGLLSQGMEDIPLREKGKLQATFLKAFTDA